MKRINKKLRKQTMAVMLALALVIGMTAGITSFADELGKFDPVFYAQTYPDVAAVLGTDAEALYNHYITCGQKEGRVPYAGAAVGAEVDGIAGTAPVSSGAMAHSKSEARKLWQQGLPHGYQPDYSLYEYTPEQMALAEQKQQEFDASGLVHVGWTEEQVYERLMWIKANLYPEGTKVGICEAGAGKIVIDLYGMAMWRDAGWDKNEEQQLFPIGLVYSIEGYANDRPIPLGGNIKDMIRVGDKLYTQGAAGAGHVQVVLSHNDYGITVVESNIGGDEKMHWGRFISWDELENGGYMKQDKWTRMVHYLY